MFLTAQIFAAPTGRTRNILKNNVANFEVGLVKEDDISTLLRISKDIQQGWDEKYNNKRFKPPKMFQSRKVNQEKTRKIDQQYFNDPELVEIRKLTTALILIVVQRYLTLT